METCKIIIEPNKRSAQMLKELWQFRELFFLLAWRDVLVRYKQTIFGVLWSIIRPVLTMVIFVVIFGGLAKLPSEGVPYPILVYAALLPWQFFANTFSMSSASLVANAGLVSKVYFPRIILPSTSMLVSLIDFGISFLVFTALMVWYSYNPGWRIVVLPFLLLHAGMTALGVGYFLAALNVKYRDFAQIVPFILQLGLFISPVGFSSSLVPDKWRLLYSINPMVGVIDGFRWALLGGESALYLPSFLLSIVLAFILFFGGAAFLMKTERFFADVI